MADDNINRRKGDTKGKEQSQGRWCIICNKHLSTCKTYVKLHSSKIMRQSLMENLNNIIGEDVIGSKNRSDLLCRRCHLQTNNICKLKDLKSRLKRLYHETRDKHAVSTVSEMPAISQTETPEVETPEVETPEVETPEVEKQQQPAAFSPGTPQSADSKVMPNLSLDLAWYTKHHVKDISVTSEPPGTSFASLLSNSVTPPLHGDDTDTITIKQEIGDEEEEEGFNNNPCGRYQSVCVDIVDIRDQLSGTAEPLFQHPTTKCRVFDKACQTADNVSDNMILMASATIPEGLWCQGKRGGQDLGVFSTRDIQRGKEFGPYTGKLVGETQGRYSPFTWEVCIHGQTMFYVDGEMDPNNWMSQVEVACSVAEQNLEAVQNYGRIFFRATRDIRPGESLKVFYSPDYSKQAGFKVRLADLAMSEDSKVLECQECKDCFSNAKNLMRHHKFEHAEKFKESERPDTTGKDNVDIDMHVDDNSNTSFESQDVGLPQSNPEVSISRNDFDHESSAVNQKIEAVSCDNHNGNNSPSSKPEQLTRPLDHRAIDAPISSGTAKRKEIDKVLKCKIEASDPKKSGQHIESLASESTKSYRQTNASKAPYKEPREDVYCMVCGEVCADRLFWKQHEMSHDPTCYQCPICKKYFKRKGCILFHLRHYHQVKTGSKNGLREMRALRLGDTDHIEDRENWNSPLGVIFGIRPICHFCREEFQDYDSLKEHLMSHDSNCLKCQFCVDKFNDKVKLFAHIQDEHRISLVGLSNGTIAAIKRKARKKKNSFVILHFPGQSAPADTRGDEPETVAKPCSEELPFDMLGRHVDIAPDKGRIFKCRYCSKHFSSRYLMIQHKKMKHRDAAPYSCKFCPYSCRTRFQYLVHRRTHTDYAPFKCKVCLQSFATETLLINHKKVHCGNRSFACSMCDKGFERKGLLKAHVKRSHVIRSKLYECSFCDRMFRKRWDRWEHERRHQGIRRFLCATCGKSFGSKCVLQTHQRTHTGEKPYACKICYRLFSIAHNLMGHMLWHKTEKRGVDSFKSKSDVSRCNGGLLQEKGIDASHKARMESPPQAKLVCETIFASSVSHGHPGSDAVLVNRSSAEVKQRKKGKAVSDPSSKVPLGHYLKKKTYLVKLPPSTITKLVPKYFHNSCGGPERTRGKHRKYRRHLRCMACKKTFRLQKSLEKHSCAKQMLGLFFCAYCGKEFPSRLMLNAHSCVCEILVKAQEKKNNP